MLTCAIVITRISISIQTDRFGEIVIELDFLLLCQCILGNRLEGLVNIDGFLSRRLKVWNVTLGLAPSLSALLRNDTFGLVHIDLISKNDEWKVVRIAWRCLDQKFVSPAVQSFKGFRVGDVVNEHAAVRATIERYTQRLESLLASGIPDLIYIDYIDNYLNFGKLNNV